MRKVLGLTAVSMVVLFSSTASADWPSGVTAVQVEADKTVSTTGKLEAGAPMQDLSWAAKSSMACFPATQNSKFRGNHVFYAASLPAHAEMIITVTPTDPSKDLSLYAYSVGKTNFQTPPAIQSAVSCEADYKWDRPKKGQTQGASRSVKLNAIANPYNVLIGVSGPAGATAGEYTLSIELKGGAAAPAASGSGADTKPSAAAQATNAGQGSSAKSWPASVTPIVAEKGKSVSVTGKLESGAPMEDLSWAARSSMACFPATQNARFRGNQVFFSASIPARSTMDITVAPTDTSKDLSIYAYQIGTTNFSMPPTIQSAVSCEAEYKWDRPKKGKTQDSTRTVHLEATTNPYNVFIGVSGPAEATSGDFTVTVTTK